MSDRTKPEILDSYSEGRLGTGQAIALAGFDGYADLLNAMAQADLTLPKPAETPSRRADVERASAILQPRLRQDGD